MSDVIANPKTSETEDDVLAIAQQQPLAKRPKQELDDRDAMTEKIRRYETTRSEELRKLDSGDVGKSPSATEIFSKLQACVSNSGSTSDASSISRANIPPTIGGGAAAPATRGSRDKFVTKMRDASAIRDESSGEKKKTDRGEKNDRPYTLSELHASGRTPDVDLSDLAEALGKSNLSDEAESLCALVGRRLEDEWFFEAGGPKYFYNFIRGAATRSADAELAMGVSAPEDVASRSGELDGGNGTRCPRSAADLTPSTIAAEWMMDRATRTKEIERARREDSAAAVGTNEPYGARAIDDANPREMLEWAKCGADRVERSVIGRDVVEMTPEHCAYYLFEPCGRERACVCGDACVARTTLYHECATMPASGEIGAGEVERAGVVLKEFLSPAERERLIVSGENPAVHGPCLICIRDWCTVSYFLATLNDTRRCYVHHSNPVELPGGYKRSACLVPQKTSNKGAAFPFRHFATNEYVPTTLAAAVDAGVLKLASRESDMLASCVRAFAESAVRKFASANVSSPDSPAISVDDVLGRFANGNAIPHLRGYVEIGSVFYYRDTRAMSPAAISLGTEPCTAYVPALTTRDLSRTSQQGAAKTTDRRRKRSPSSPHNKFDDRRFPPHPSFSSSNRDAQTDETKEDEDGTRSFAFEFDIDRDPIVFEDRDLWPPRAVATVDSESRFVPKEEEDVDDRMSRPLLSRDEIATAYSSPDREIISDENRRKQTLLECSSRVGISPETMDLILGPFHVFCRAVRAALLFVDPVASVDPAAVATAFGTPSTTTRPKSSIEDAADAEAFDDVTKLEIAFAAKRLHAWEEIPMPSPPQDSSLFVAALIRSEVVKEVGMSVDMDLVDIARTKAATRIKTEEDAIIDAVTKTLAFDSWDNLVAAHAANPEDPNLQIAVEGGPDKWRDKRAAAIESALKKLKANQDSRMVPFPARTERQLEIEARLDSIVSWATAAGLVTTEGKPVDKTVNFGGRKKGGDCCGTSVDGDGAIPPRRKRVATPRKTKTTAAATAPKRKSATPAQNKRKKVEIKPLPLPPPISSADGESIVRKEAVASLAELNAAEVRTSTASIASRMVELCGLICDRRRKRLSQKILDRVFQTISEFAAAQRPISRALVRLARIGEPTDDASLLGSLENGCTAYMRSAMGTVDPDSFASDLVIPRRPTHLTLAPSATVMANAAAVKFEESSGLSKRRWLPTPASFLVPDLPICRVKFPTHRRAILAALVSGKFGREIGPTTRVADVLASTTSSFPPTSKYTLAECLDEFWRAAAWMRRCEESEDFDPEWKRFANACGPIDKIARTMTIFGVGNRSRRSPSSAPVPSSSSSIRIDEGTECDSRRRRHRYCCSLIATAMTRIAVAGVLIAKTRDPVLVHRLHAFQWTHSDLLFAIDWSAPASSSLPGWCDEILTSEETPSAFSEFRQSSGKSRDGDDDASSTTPTKIRRGLRIADVAYPFDERTLVDEDMPPVAADLALCGFFEPTANPKNNKTFAHVNNKALPHACGKRSIRSIMRQTIRRSTSFSIWFVGALRNFLRGTYAHASVRPPFLTAATVCERILMDAEEDIDLRIREFRLRPAAKKYARKREKMIEAIDPFGSNAIESAINVAKLFSSVANFMRTVTNDDSNVEPYESGKISVVRALIDSLVAEIERRIKPHAVGAIASMVERFVERTVDSSSEKEGAEEDRAGLRSAVDWAIDAVGTYVKGDREWYRGWATDVAIESGFESDGKGEERVTEVVVESIRFAAEGCLSSARPEDVCAAAEIIVDAVTSALETAYPSAVRACELTVAFADPPAFFGLAGRFCRDEILELATKMRANRRSLSAEVVTRACVVACKRAFSNERSAEGPRFMERCTRESHKRAAADGLERTIISVCASTIAGLDRSLFCGFADVALLAVAQGAGDMVDVWNSTVYDFTEPTSQRHACNIVSSACDVVRAFYGDAAAEFVRTELCAAAEGNKSKRTAFERSTAVETAVSQILLATYSAVYVARERWSAGIRDSLRGSRFCGGVSRSRSVADAKIDPWLASELKIADRSGAELTRAISNRALDDASSIAKVKSHSVEDLVALSGRVVATTLAMAGSVAERAGRYSDSGIKCELLSFDKERYDELQKRLAGKQPFVVKHATICQYAVREALMAQLSRNPSLSVVFATRGEWFPDFVSHVVRTCDKLRDRISRRLALPADEEVAALAFDDARNGGWGSAVYRLYKLHFSALFLKTAEQHESELTAAEVRIGPAFRPDPERIALMREYVQAMVEAEGADVRPNPERDMAVLWTFGMREHGLDVIARLHSAYGRNDGKKEFYRVMNRFAVDEYLLAFEYYRAVTSANSIASIPMLSSKWSEGVASAIRTKYVLGDAAISPEQLVLTVCDSCSAILTRMPTKDSTSPSKQTSCYAVLVDEDGNETCLGKRKSNKKKQTASVETKEEEKEDEDAAATPSPPEPKRARFDATSPIRMQMTCKKQRARKILAAGAIADFNEKYIGKGENSTVAKQPCVITGCCGTCSRFSFDLWGADGYRCVACSTIRGTGPALPVTCAVCGVVCKPPKRGSKKKKKAVQTEIVTASIEPVADEPTRKRKRSSGTGKTQMLTITSNEPDQTNAGDEVDRVEVPRQPPSKRRKLADSAKEELAAAKAAEECDTTKVSGVPLPLDWTRAEDSKTVNVRIHGCATVIDTRKLANMYYRRLQKPVVGIEGPCVRDSVGGTADSPVDLLCVIDDDVTGTAIPVAVCARCRDEARKISTREMGPVAISRIRESVRTAMCCTKDAKGVARSRAKWQSFAFKRCSSGRRSTR